MTRVTQAGLSDTSLKGSPAVTVIYTVAQQKGGVGKTTTAINVAVALARAGQSVLAVDVDPQFALSRQLGLKPHELALSLVDALSGQADAADIVVHDVFGVDVLPGHRDLVRVELSLATQVARDTYLRRTLQPIADDYDSIVIDTPPNLGLLTVNALVPADVVIAPVDAEQEGSAQGLAEVRATLSQLEQLRGGTQPRLVVLMTRWDKRRLMARVVEQAVETNDFHIAARIPLRTALQHAAAWRRPIVDSDPDGEIAHAYIAFTDMLIAAEVA